MDQFDSFEEGILSYFHNYSTVLYQAGTAGWSQCGTDESVRDVGMHVQYSFQKMLSSFESGQGLSIVFNQFFGGCQQFPPKNGSTS